MEKIKFQSFTYFKNDNDKRAFTLVDVDYRGIEQRGVVMLEWGDPGRNFIRLTIEKFTALVEEGKLKEFIPQYQP